MLGGKMATPANQLKELEQNKVYRVKRRDIGGLRYTLMYDEGKFIHVRVLEGPGPDGRYTTTTRGEDGQHLGPGGGWEGMSGLFLWPFEVEEIAT